MSRGWPPWRWHAWPRERRRSRRRSRPSARNLSSREIDHAVAAAIALEIFGRQGVGQRPGPDQYASPNPRTPDSGESLGLGRQDDREPRPGTLHAEDAIAALIKALESRNEFARAQLCAALGEFGPPPNPPCRCFRSSSPTPAWPSATNRPRPCFGSKPSADLSLSRRNRANRGPLIASPGFPALQIRLSS